MMDWLKRQLSGWWEKAIYQLGAYRMVLLYPAEIVLIAQHELGRGEVKRNNRGDAIAKYRMGKGRPGHSWCAWFVSWVLITAAIKLGIAPPVKSTGGARNLFRQCVKAGRKLEKGEVPRPGDIVCWYRGKRILWLKTWKRHIGIVVKGGWNFITIEGNVGAVPSVVSEFPHHLDEPDLAGIARLI